MTVRRIKLVHGEIQEAAGPASWTVSAVKPASASEAPGITRAATDDPFGEGRPTRGHVEVEDETPRAERREGS